MKAFIINLKTETAKRQRVSERCNALGLDYEVIEAVVGKGMQPEVIEAITYDHANSKITDGVVGCTLSHLHIYTRMVNENIPYALIMEDDIDIHESALPIIQSIEKIIRPQKEEIFLLNTPEAITPLISRHIGDGYIFYRMARASQSPGYIINQKTAQKLLSFNFPIKYEVDRWMAFRDYCGIKIWALEKGVIDSYDDDKSDSTLEEDRSKCEHDRSNFLSRLRKKEKKYQSKRLMNLLIKKISNKDILIRS